MQFEKSALGTKRMHTTAYCGIISLAVGSFPSTMQLGANNLHCLMYILSIMLFSTAHKRGNPPISTLGVWTASSLTVQYIEKWGILRYSNSENMSIAEHSRITWADCIPHFLDHTDFSYSQRIFRVHSASPQFNPQSYFSIPIISCISQSLCPSTLLTFLIIVKMIVSILEKSTSLTAQGSQSCVGSGNRGPPIFF